MSAPVEESGEAAERPVLSKVDPESLALRAQSARVIRFKRGAIIAIAALGSAGLVATAWFALQPTALQLARQEDDSGSVAKLPSDAISRLPDSYADVPQLGPPLPGDLGRPILEHQRAMAGTPGTTTADTGQAAAAEREASERRAARASGLLVQSAARAQPAVARDAMEPGFSIAQETDGFSGPCSAACRVAEPAIQGRGQEFAARRDTGSDINPHRIVPAPSRAMLSAGSVIAASLITGLTSDLPGLVIAQVTERVFDSATGSMLLIPQGARLIGKYDNVVAFGQSRALIVWQRLILPDGSSVRLDNEPATDPAGYAGLADKVDFHSWGLLKGVAMSTLLGVGANLSFSGESDLVRAIRESTQQNGARAGDQMAARNLDVQPTITIRPGAPVRLIVHRDLILAPWRTEETE